VTTYLALFVTLAFALVFGVAAAQDEDRYFVYISNEYSADISVIDSSTDTVVATIDITGGRARCGPAAWP
jgi:YVTN family beta-propeller protein